MEIDQSISKLYDAFGGYPLKSVMDKCPDCDLEATEASLRARALRELSWVDFGVYPFKAMTTFGDVEDFKHFLPRIFELYILDHDHARYDLSVLFGKLQDADWTSWPEREVTAIRSHVDLWLRLLTEQQRGSQEEHWQLEDLLDALAETDFEADGTV